MRRSTGHLTPECTLCDMSKYTAAEVLLMQPPLPLEFKHLALLVPPILCTNICTTYIHTHAVVLSIHFYSV